MSSAYTCVQAPCGKCGTMVTVEVQTNPVMANTELISAAIWDHPKTSTCIGCGSKVVGLIMKVTGVAVVAAPVEDQSCVITASILPMGR